MRRYLVPVSILALAIAATVLAVRANGAADQTQGGAEATVVPRVATPVLSATRIPEWLRQPESDAALDNALTGSLDVLPDGAVDRSCLTVHRDGVEVTAQNPGTTVTPGDALRLVTAAVAFELVPPDSRYSTRVEIAAGVEIAEGELRGDLWLIGNGDPTMSTPSYIDRFGDDRARTSLVELAERLATRLRELGVSTVTGSVVGDESRYGVERDYEGDVWDRDDNADNAVGPLSALLLDDGFESWPPELDPGANVRSADPAATAATRLGVLLALQGIQVVGAPRSGDAPDGREPEPLATIDSAPLDAVVARAMVDATTAEMLLKEIGLRSGGDGRRATAVFGGTLNSLTRLGIDLGYDEGDLANVIADGSGLSDLNAITCTALAQIMRHPDVGPSVVAALPPAAGTPLAGCVPDGATDLRLLASAEEDHTSVAGVFTAANGDTITFALLASGPDLGAALGPCNQLQAMLLEVLAGHPYGPDLSTIVPDPAVTD